MKTGPLDPAQKRAAAIKESDLFSWVKRGAVGKFWIYWLRGLRLTQ
jgi:hypothetical protein